MRIYQDLPKMLSSLSFQNRIILFLLYKMRNVSLLLIAKISQLKLDMDKQMVSFRSSFVNSISVHLTKIIS